MPVLSRPTLIGTIHLDMAAECGPMRIVLEKLRPEIIAVEISPFSVFYRLKNQKRWLSLFYKNIAPLTEKERLHSGLKLLKLQIMMPFEWRVARHYGGEKGIPVLAIDSGAQKGLERIIKIARTIADIEGNLEISISHLAEAIQYRGLDRRMT